MIVFLAIAAVVAVAAACFLVTGPLRRRPSSELPRDSWSSFEAQFRASQTNTQAIGDRTRDGRTHVIGGLLPDDAFLDLRLTPSESASFVTASGRRDPGQRTHDLACRLRQAALSSSPDEGAVAAIATS